MGHSLVPVRITARVIRRFQNNIFRRAMINMAESLRVHSLIARAALHSRASAGCNFGQTAGPSLIKRHDRQSITAVLQHLHWLPVKWRIHYKIVVLVFRALHGLAPAYVTTLITSYEPRRALRSAGTALLCVPRHNLERYGRRSFSCAGPALWNSLPETMRLADSLNTFKSQLKTHYFKLAYNL